MLDLKTHLKDLCAAPGIAGHEASVRATIEAAWADYVDTFETDGLGSLIALRRGAGPEPRRRVMICTHMDAIGLMVADICDGFILTTSLGGVDYRVLLAQPVIVHGRRDLPGVVGAAPPHMSLDRNKYPGKSELWVDVGLPAADVAELVRVGDVISFDAPLIELRNGRVAARALDNRASVAALTLCLDELIYRRHDWDVYAVASAQEETSGSGAQTAAFRIEPDIALVVDGTFGDQRGVDDDSGFELGEGPTIGLGPNFHPGLRRALEKRAKAEDVPFERELMTRNSGTDAWTIQVTRAGVPSALLSIPMRNMHSPVETVDLRDIRLTARLMAAFITHLDEAFMDDIAWSLPDPGEEQDA